ncbi:hypothetical protein B0H14DRAFT_1285652 [Mycena olivaceomarginata]|nr:hypothetical protein B0H14DRAFT_1285652 [Mycena olivaceomarginata]
MRLPFRRRPGSSSRPSSRPSFQQRLARKSGDERDRVQLRAIRSARRGWDTTCRQRERDSGDYIPSIGADSSIQPRQCLRRSPEERFLLAADGTHGLAIMRAKGFCRCSAAAACSGSLCGSQRQSGLWCMFNSCQTQCSWHPNHPDASSGT